MREPGAAGPVHRRRLEMVLFGQTSAGGVVFRVRTVAAADEVFVAVGGPVPVGPAAAVRPVAAPVIRDARDGDWPAIWPIVRDVVTEQRTFPYDPALTEAAARRMWLLAPPARVVVAADGARVTGTANMYANRAGPGSHVASGSLMVAKQERGTGVGRALTTELIAWARRTGFAAIQFNAVVDVNTAAVRLYESLGFVTLGVAPGAFRHPDHGEVGLRIMWLDLREA
ncbi:GNAT family N-acetyltransferase [Amycolatopsis sp. OK19-0408]|uniref:GNAT family N-acetyltransferase n=1 Tax=Amycolatopsis iheyensis TaxID=2945988 RepID=A0A9X2NK58_9PSEU|nr:GNAT family N-acetyltransferase [Amycolatopsis iheyensis]MCR6488044.1 GNAT family N-acetyltransferase [Amycolatopsis iheyensis]